MSSIIEPPLLEYVETNAPVAFFIPVSQVVVAALAVAELLLPAGQVVPTFGAIIVILLVLLQYRLDIH